MEKRTEMEQAPHMTIEPISFNDFKEQHPDLTEDEVFDYFNKVALLGYFLQQNEHRSEAYPNWWRYKLDYENTRRDYEEGRSVLGQEADR